MIFITFPEVLTVVWAIMASKVRNKRLVIVFGAVFQIAAACFLISKYDKAVLGFTLNVFALICAKAAMTPVIEALIVNQSKRDLDRGSEDIATFGMFAEMSGALIFCLFGGMIVTRRDPRGIFYLYVVTGLLILITSLKYPNESEEPVLTEHE